MQSGSHHQLLRLVHACGSHAAQHFHLPTCKVASNMPQINRVLYFILFYCKYKNTYTYSYEPEAAQTQTKENMRTYVQILADIKVASTRAYDNSSPKKQDTSSI